MAVTKLIKLRDAASAAKDRGGRTYRAVFSTCVETFVRSRKILERRAKNSSGTLIVQFQPLRVWLTCAVVVTPLLKPAVHTMLRCSVLPDFVRQFRLYLDQPLPAEIETIPVPPALIPAVPKRRTQFRGGRYCAMKAIEALGAAWPGKPIGRSATGAPLWPAGLVGSITHTDDVAAAAVARTTDTVGIGIDTERIMTESLARNVNRIVAWPAELAHARDAGLTRLESLTLVFSAKESLFKCLHPSVGCHFDFRDVRIVAVHGHRRRFAARLVRTLSEAFPARTILLGSFDVDGPWIHTGIVLPSSMNLTVRHTQGQPAYVEG